jgi:hypothetical protein
MQPAPCLAPGSSAELLSDRSALAGGKATMPWLDRNLGEKPGQLPAER